MHMAQTTAPRPKYTAGQRVEVFAFDFETPGYPEVWQLGVVASAVLREDGLWDVLVERDNGKVTALIVGKRGGNKHIRAAA